MNNLAELLEKASYDIGGFFFLMGRKDISVPIRSFIDRIGHGEQDEVVFFQDYFDDYEDEYGYFQPDTLMYSAGYPAIQLPDNKGLVWIMPYRQFYELLDSYIQEYFSKKHPERINELASLMEELYLSFGLDKQDDRIWEPYVVDKPADPKNPRDQNEILILGKWVE
jgi:hypothetical protein